MNTADDFQCFTVGRVIIDYTNWKGVRRKRRIWPNFMHLSSTQYHPETQWLINAMDLEEQDPDKAVKDFAMKDIHSWEPANG